MFKKKIAALLTCFVVASTAMATNVQALKTKELTATKQTIESKDVEGRLVTNGFVAEKSGDYIIVVGEAEADEGAFNQLILIIDDETEIENTKGYRLSKDKIEAGSVVEVVYEGKETNSLIPYVAAKKIIVKDGVGREGTVLEIRKSSNKNTYYLTMGKNKEEHESQFTLIIGENTELVDKDGDKLAINEIEEGMKIVGIHSMRTTKSIPPQSQAFKIIVMEDIKENKHIVEGMVEVIVDIDNENKSEDNKEAFLSIIGKGITDNTDGKLNIFINKSTKIIDEDGVRVSLEKIKEGSVVEVIYNTRLTDDNQETPDAEKIIIKNSSAIKGKILGINEYRDNSFILVGDNQETNSYDEMALIVGENTEILDINGNKLSLYNLNEGMEIVGIHSMMATLSLPPQSQAYTIIVTSEIKETKQAVEGMIYKVVNSDKKRISVIGESLTENAPNFVDLYIDGNTEIVNEEGQKLDLNDLEEGTAIEAVFGQKLTKSAIPIGTAHKIVIKNALGAKGEISNTSDEKAYIEIKKSDNFYDSIILKINDDTEIVDLDGKELSREDLNKGDVVIGIHSLATTRSLPPQSVAYKIIVLEKSDYDDDDEDDHDEDNDDHDKDDDHEYKSEMYIMGYASVYEKHGDMMIRVRNQSNGKGKIKEVILEIDKKTEIVDVQGNRVTFEQLVSSSKKVKVYFTASESRNGTMEGKAKKIVIQGKPVKHGKGKGNKKK